MVLPASREPRRQEAPGTRECEIRNHHRTDRASIGNAGETGAPE
jgi:hypothetical protein